MTTSKEYTSSPETDPCYKKIYEIPELSIMILRKLNEIQENTEIQRKEGNNT